MAIKRQKTRKKNGFCNRKEKNYKNNTKDKMDLD